MTTSDLLLNGSENDNSSNLKAAVIGCGEQGSALVKGLSQNTTTGIIGCDRNQNKLDKLDQHLEKSFSEAGKASSEADIIFLAVKPSSVEKVLDSLQLEENQVLVSVAAGVRTEFLRERTEAQVIRMMPNLAAKHGKMAASVAETDTNSCEKQKAISLLDKVGEVVLVEEKLMDLSTALNGSGPAFVYYLMKTMKEAAEKHGLESEKAEKLSIQTFKGASEIASNSDRNLGGLIEAVCSPNGTTIEGIKSLNQSNIDQEIYKTLEKTEKRSREISSNFSSKTRK